MTRVLIAMLLIAGTGLAQAQVYKCTSPDGTAAFSDRPCSESAEIITELDSGTSGVGTSASGPPSSLTLDDGSILRFKKIISIDVQTEAGYKTGRKGMHIFFEGTDRLVEFENLVSLQVTTWGRDSCGNWSAICEPRVRIKTAEREIIARYKSLRHVKILIDDELDGVEKEMTVYFAIKNKPHIRSIRF